MKYFENKETCEEALRILNLLEASPSKSALFDDLALTDFGRNVLHLLHEYKAVFSLTSDDVNLNTDYAYLVKEILLTRIDAFKKAKKKAWLECITKWVSIIAGIGGFILGIIANARI